MSNRENGVNDGRHKTKRRLFVSILVTFVIFVAGIGVVWVKSLPTLTVAEGAITISNCEPPLPTYAIGICPKLQCKKLIMESGRFPEQLQIGFVKAKPSADQVLHGSIRYVEAGASNPSVTQFLCELQSYEIRKLKYIN